MARAENGKINFAVMYATHDAFRRDLEKFEAAVASGRPDSPGVRAGWANFRRQLDVHHSVEDAALWPQVEKAVAGRADQLEILHEMEAEHAGLEPLVEAVDHAMADPAGSGDLAERVRALSAALGGHMRHEEDRALPLIQEVLTQKDWDAFARAMARKQGPSGAAAYIPWVLDGTDADGRRAFLGQMPAPVGVAHKLFLQKRYQKQNYWAA